MSCTFAGKEESWRRQYKPISGGCVCISGTYILTPLITFIYNIISLVLPGCTSYIYMHMYVANSANISLKCHSTTIYIVCVLMFSQGKFQEAAKLYRNAGQSQKVGLLKILAYVILFIWL